MKNTIVSILAAVLVVLAVPGIAPASQDDDQQASPSSICEFLPWLPGCDFFN